MSTQALACTIFFAALLFVILTVFVYFRFEDDWVFGWVFGIIIIGLALITLLSGLFKSEKGAQPKIEQDSW